MFNPQNPELLELNRQRRMAELLVKQGFETPQGQTVSGGVYVPSHPLQQIANLYSVYAGTKKGEELDAKEQALAQKLRELGATETKDILGTLKGTPEVVTELAGPAYQGVSPTAVMPAKAGDANAALAQALMAQSPQAQRLVPSLIEQANPKPIAEQIKYNLAKEGGYKGSFNDFINQMSEADKARIALDKQRLGLEGARLNLEQQKVAQELALGKPLTGEAAKQVIGATNLKSAVDNYKTMLKDFNTIDFANPNARAKIGEAYNNMMLQAKEAYNLGVLNGPDYQILTSIVKDPTSMSSLLVSKKTLEDQADSLKGYSDTIIKNVYSTHQRPIPGNLVNPSNPTTTTTGKGGIPAGVTPELWNVMTPEEKAAFK